jgi:hypothetical protein
MSEAAKLLMRTRHPTRDAYSGEDEFFRGNPAVAGYAADDGNVVINPYSPLPEDATQSVALNEAARHTQWNQGVLHSFPLTDGQEKFFSRTPYAEQPQQAKHSVVARLISDDPSAAPYTDAQKIAAHGVLYRSLLDKPLHDEKAFQQWYSGWAQKAGLNPDPDPQLHQYDYRAAFRAGVEPEIDPGDGFYHWPSQFKSPDHPNRYVDGIDTITGRPR